MNIDETRWMMFHFEPDALEQASIAFTIEIFKTLAVVIFGLIVMELVL